MRLKVWGTALPAVVLASACASAPMVEAPKAEPKQDLAKAYGDDAKAMCDLVPKVYAFYAERAAHWSEACAQAQVEAASVTTPRQGTTMLENLVEALWDNQSWRTTTWLGRPVNRYPTDLHSYQELLAQVEPSVVVVIGDDDGLAGRALYLSSVLAALGHGRVVVAGDTASDTPESDAVTVVTGAVDDPETIAAVRRAVGGEPALLLIGLGATERVLGAFNGLEDLVRPGGFVVVENTVVNGRPVASSFGPGPHEAVVHILGSRTDWAPDVAFERFTVTFNKGGYLRRLAPA